MASLTPRIDSLQASKNLIINGNFDFWQRGTSFSPIANGVYSADRWKWSKGGTTSLQNVTQDSDVPTLDESGYTSLYSLKVTQTATTDTVGAAKDTGLHYLMEGYDYSEIHGKSFLFQFWVKSSLTGNFPLSFSNSTGNRNYVTYYTINAPNTWELKSIFVSPETIGTWTFNNGRGMRINLGLMVGSNFQSSTVNTWHTTASLALAPSGVTLVNFAGTNGATWLISQVQLIPLHSSASPSNASIIFSRAGKTIQQELSMCQRYYEVYTAAGNTLNALVLGSFSTTGAEGVHKFLVTKRTVPSISFPNGTSADWRGNGSTGTGTLSASLINIDSTRVTLTTTGLVTSQIYGVFISNNSLAIAADSEL